MTEVLTPPDALSTIRLLPVVVVHEASQVDGLVDGLVNGGVPNAEITLRSPYGLEAIRRAVRRGGIVIGAGTVRSPAEATAAADAGAEFIVSPGFDEAIGEVAHAAGLPYVPGVATATEVQRALAAGYRHIKFFPAEAAGGVRALTALRGPFPEIRFLPSGGVTMYNAREYLHLENVFAVSGSWLTPPRALASGDSALITSLCRAARRDLGL